MGGLSYSRVGPACRGSQRAVSRVAVIALIAAAFVAFATVAEAQIYVIEEADGTQRYTNEYRPGAKLYMDTRHSVRAERPRPMGPNPFRREITDASTLTGVDAKLVEAIIAAESSFDPRALSKKGAQGLMQLMPETAQRFNVANVWDPKQNIAGGTAYLAELMSVYKADLPLVLAAYNAGEGAVERHGGVPPYRETREYVDKVLDYYRRLGGR